MSDSKTADSGSFLTVRNEKTGKDVTIRGVGFLRDSGWTMKPGVDLTKPIASQVLKGARRKKG